MSTNATCVILRAGLWIGCLGLFLMPALVRAQQKIPALVQVPTDLPDSEQQALEQQREALRQQFAVFQAAANAFNAKTAEEQTDAEFNAVQGMRKRYIEAASLFNQTVRTDARSSDPMVVETRGAREDQGAAVESWLAGLSKTPGVADRLHKGWMAYTRNDLNVAIAWFEDALNHDPNNANLKALVGWCRQQRTLLASPAFRSAVTRGVDRYASAATPLSDPAEVRQLWPAKDTVQLPEDSDMEFLFPSVTANDLERIRSGLALPVRDPQLNLLLEQHPELRPQLLAAWKEACAQREQAEADSMASAIKRLATRAADLGLQPGRFEETLAKDPGRQAQWQEAVFTESQKEEFAELNAAFSALGKLDSFVDRLSETAGQPHSTEVQRDSK